MLPVAAKVSNGTEGEVRTGEWPQRAQRRSKLRLYVGVCCGPFVLNLLLTFRSKEGDNKTKPPAKADG